MLLKNKFTILRKMIDVMNKGKSIYLPSKHWKFYSEKHINQLKQNGLENFRTIQAFNYFTFLIFNYKDLQFKNVWNNSSLKSKFISFFTAITSQPFSTHFMTKRQRLIYIMYVCLLWEYVKRFDKKNLLSTTNPKLGNPLLVKYKGKLITQDLSNSVLETYSMLEALSALKDKNPEIILELGGGYGRNAYVLKHLFPRSKIIMVDIPPALFIAQWYLNSVFSASKNMLFRDFSSFKEIEKEYQESDFIFLLPHQIEYLPSKIVNLFLNISSLHEMHLAQIRNYFNQIDRLTSGIFYTKQYKIAKNDFDKIYIKENEYPIRRTWRVIFHRNARIQSEFFEVAYKI